MEKDNGNVAVVRKDLKELKENFRSGNIKREYKLTRSSKLELWLDKLRLELNVNDLIDVIVSNVKARKAYDDEQQKLRKHRVREIIMLHTDECYHRRVLKIEEPRTILEMLREFKRNEMNVTHSSIRTLIHTMKFNPRRENVYSFCKKFDSLIGKYENTVGAVQIDDFEKRSAFY